MSDAATMPMPALSEALPDLRLGYVPLTDAAPLLVAAERGMFRRHGLKIDLTAAGSWSALRDRVAAGIWHGGQMLGPMPIACYFGLGQAQANLTVTATLGRNGNTLVLSNRLIAEIGACDWPLSPSRLATALAVRLAAGQSAPVLAVVFPFSSHNYLLRHWLASAGIDPERDVRLVVLPPSLLPEALADGRIDGFCAGEPWGSRAVDLEVGQILLSSRHIWPNHPEKVLAFTDRTLARDPAPAIAATAAVIEAAAWLGQPENRAEAASILHRAGLSDVPEAVIALALDEQLIRAPGEAATPMHGAILHGATATRPDPAHAAWWLRAMRRWGHLPAGDNAVLDQWQPHLWQRAAELTVFGPIAPLTDQPPHFRRI